MKKKVTKVLLIIAVSVIIIGILGVGGVFGINAYVKNVGGKNIISAEEAALLEGYDCIMVLGCGVQDDGSPSAMLLDRLIYGVDLYKAKAAPKLLMTGDHGSIAYDEVNVMKNYAIENGVPSEDVFMDHAGFSTYESVYRARDIFGVKKMVIVTQEYHLYRALYIAEKLGIEAKGVACDRFIYANQRAREIREILARDKDFFYCIFKPLPTYLGEAIPVSGDGNITND